MNESMLIEKSAISHYQTEKMNPNCAEHHLYRSFSPTARGCFSPTVHKYSPNGSPEKSWFHKCFPNNVKERSPNAERFVTAQHHKLPPSRRSPVLNSFGLFKYT